MLLRESARIVLGLAIVPFIYYLIALYSAWRFFGRAVNGKKEKSDFTPPLSILKPVKGLDPEAYENFASFCRQDYPEYELVFCIDSTNEATLRVIDRLRRDYPERSIRVLFGPLRQASNDKVARLARLTSEAAHEYLAISDSDVRVEPDYLRTVVAPLADPNVGGVTCLYVSIEDNSFLDKLQTISMLSDFYAGVVVARQLDGVKFAFGQTVVTTRSRLSAFGGYQLLENRPADDLLVGRLIAETGHKIELLPYAVKTVADYESIRDLLYKRLRWMVVMRHMRPWGHLGLLLTQALPWTVAAIAIRPAWGIVLGYFGTYAALRLALTWTIAIWGLKQPTAVLKKAVLIPVWDAAAFGIWLVSFLRNRIRWRGYEYQIRNGELVPTVDNTEEITAARDGRSAA